MGRRPLRRRADALDFHGRATQLLLSSTEAASKRARAAGGRRAPRGGLRVQVRRNDSE